MLKALLFDVDGTIFDYNRSHALGMEAVCAYMRDEFGWTEEETHHWHDTIRESEFSRLGLNNAAIHNRLIRFQIILEKNHLPIEPHAMNMFHAYWDTHIAHAHPEPGLYECVETAKAKGIKIGIITDMTAYTQYRKMMAVGMLKYVDFIVSSEEAGLEKPEAGFFLQAAAKAEANPEECLMIGDNYKKDVLGAEGAGMQAYWYKPDEGRTYEELMKELGWK